MGKVALPILYLRNLIVRSAIDQLLAPDREAQWLFTGIEQWSILIQLP
jgi:hypothetical protein